MDTSLIKKGLRFGLYAATAVASCAASAAPLTLPGNSPLYIQYTDSEQVSLANNIGNTSGTAAS